MRGNTISLKLQRGRVTQTGSLFQYDYGQRLILLGVDLPSSYEVHFSNSENGSSKTRIGSSEGVDIPDEYLTSGEKIHVWLFLHDGANDGETEYHGIINVTRRATPTDTPPTPVQQDLITQTIAALNDAVEEAEGIAEAIPGTINEALAAAKASGEFDGKDGKDGKDGADGAPGQPGRDGVDGKDGADGKDGQDGAPGADGFSPTATVTKSGNVVTISITDKNGTTSETVSDGDPTTIIDDTAGSGDTNKVWSAGKTSTAIQGKQTAPSSAGTAGQVLSLDNNLSPVWSNPSGGGTVTDVQVNGTSVLNQGVASIPLADGSNFGVVKSKPSQGVQAFSDGSMMIVKASDSVVKAGTSDYYPVVPSKQHAAAFYGLAKAAGNSDQSSSNNSVGVYTEDAKSKISDMLDAPETVSGSTPSFTAKSGIRYVCGEVATLSVTLPSSGDVEIIFESGSTATVLTLTPPSGVTGVKWAGSFDPTSLEANTVYDMIITDGKYGVCASWT